MGVSRGYSVQMIVSDTSAVDSATSTFISSVTVGGDSTGKGATYPALPNPLEPILISTIAPSSSVTPRQTYTFPASIGRSGQAVVLTIQGSSSGKTFTTRLRVTLP